MDKTESLGFKISVVIPAFNSENTIIPCIESVINQTIAVSEIIVVNDGSTDNTEITVFNFIKKNEHPKIRYHFQPNAGPSRARNRGVLMANGDWIAFLDSDDQWLPEKIERQIYVITSSGCDIIGTELFRSKIPYHTANIKLISFKQLLFKNVIYTSTVILKKELLLKNPFDENQKYSEDYRLWLQICYQNVAVIMKEGLVLYNDNKGSFSLSSNYWNMEKAELSNFLLLYRKGMINLGIFLLVVSFSLLKYYLRRLRQVNDFLFSKFVLWKSK